MTLVDDLLNGSRRALARVLTQVENARPEAQETLTRLFPHTGRAHLVGVTGAPGTGKSSLVNQFAQALRGQDRTVAIVAVDPTSPFSGGAILGDRIRMRDLAGDPGVFIRSMASRGSLGGLARATSDMVKVLDAAGFEMILIETVGAGQAEVDIARHAQTVIVVEAPGLGDDVQAIKAGILEIADVLIVNKADDPRAQNTARALRMMLELSGDGQRSIMRAHHGQLLEMVLPPAPEPSGDSPQWSVPVHMTNALKGEGIGELLGAVDAHRVYLEESGELIRRDRARAAAELERLLHTVLLERILQKVETSRMTDLVDRIASRDIVPQTAVDMLIEGQV